MQRTVVGGGLDAPEWRRRGGGRRTAPGSAAAEPAALADVEELSDSLQGYHLYHATRAALLRDLRDYAAATTADSLSLALTQNAGERVLREERLADVHRSGLPFV